MSLDNKKVLIYLEESKLSPHGGPLGVGYYLHRELKAMEINNIEFLHSDNNSKSKKSKRLIENPIYKLMSNIKKAHRYNNILTNNHADMNSIIYNYDAVHFHTTLSLFENRKTLDTYKGKVILTSHSPIPLSTEIIDSLKPYERILFRKIYQRLVEMDTYAFNRADAIIFPCIYAEESYSKYLPGFNEMKKNHSEKFLYATTGIDAVVPGHSKEQVRNGLGITTSDFVVSYVGRHNEIKGYDTLKEFGSRILNRHKNVYFVIAGKEEPIKRLDHPRWIEIGWTTDAASYVGASDVFILPNKETYFDLVMLEVLSQGKIVIASNTGGNKYFNDLKAPGVFLYNTLDEADQLFEQVYKMGSDERRRIGEENRTFFETHLTARQFTKSYITNIEKILE